MWNVGPEGGTFLAWLVGLLHAQRVLEIGTSNGYSGIWIARALGATGGGLVTLEVEPRKIEMARENFVRAGLDERITLVEGPALGSLPVLGGTFELVFIDAHKPEYATICVSQAARRPRFGDRGRQRRDTPRRDGAYRDAARADPDLESVELPLAGGFFVSRVRYPDSTAERPTAW